MSRLSELQQALASGMDELEIVRRHVVYGTCEQIDDDKYFAIKDQLSSKFKIPHANIVVVGSAKLGFSIAPEKLWTPYGSHSDLDIAMVHPQLYEHYWSKIWDYKNVGGDWPRAELFNRYHFQGWMRPDLFPPDLKTPPLRLEWFEFFQDLSKKHGIRIAAGLYYSWHFLEHYQCGSIRSARQSLAQG